MTLTKAELAEFLYERVGLTKRDAKEFVDVFFMEISLCLQKGEFLNFSGFGCFQLRDKSSRPGRNPKTGDEVVVCSRRVVTFHSSIKLKSAIETRHRGKFSDLQESVTLT